MGMGMMGMMNMSSMQNPYSQYATAVSATPDGNGAAASSNSGLPDPSNSAQLQGYPSTQQGYAQPQTMNYSQSGYATPSQPLTYPAQPQLPTEQQQYSTQTTATTQDSMGVNNGYPPSYQSYPSMPAMPTMPTMPTYPGNQMAAYGMQYYQQQQQQQGYAHLNTGAAQSYPPSNGTSQMQSYPASTQSYPGYGQGGT
jgi:hypothetical protein